MPYIQPNTDITLCRDVPLDSSYNHTVDFASPTAAFNYFYSKRYVTVNVNSYQRLERNKLRIECTMEEAIKCNYLYFNNHNFEDKIFYCFITGWEYINNVTTEITYEVDVFQTFWNDVRLLQVFVEREHINVDTVGANTVPENFELGEYVTNGIGTLMPTGQQNACVIFLCNFNDDATCSDFFGGFACNVYTGLLPIKKQTIAEINEFLQRAQDNNRFGSNGDGIVAAFMCPWNPQTYDVESWALSVPKRISGALNGYTPKNNKLYTYPYNFLHVRNDVDSADFKYELFNGDYATFNLQGCIIPEPTLILKPTNYKNYATATEYRMALKNFPQVAINVDVLKVYLAQNAASLPTSMIASGVSNAIGAVGNFSVGNIIGMVGNVANVGEAVANKIAQIHDISTKPPQQKGTQSTLADYAVSAKMFQADYMSIRGEYAAIIDDYFNMFGYATHRVKQPNVTGRPYWNYVKTIGNTVDALGVPDPYLQRMNKAFNDGITIWHNPDSVGYYGYDNRPV